VYDLRSVMTFNAERNNALKSKKKGKKAVKLAAKSNAVSSLLETLPGIGVERVPEAVQIVCSEGVKDIPSMTRLADMLLQRALIAPLSERKPLAVLCRRLHDRLPR
jgi:hypothetical protein